MLRRYFVTAILSLTALAAITWKYQHYLQNPWTRDGQVRAQIVQVTPRVTGPITALYAQDNSQVKAGDLLFEIDPSTYQATLKQANAALAQAKAQLKKALDEFHRSRSLANIQPDVISQLKLTQLSNTVDIAKAAVMVADAKRLEAELNLSFTKITAPVDGFITNLNLRIGSQVVSNKPVVALIDKESFWIEGFFKETDIRDLQSGNKATVYLMTYADRPLPAKVESIGYGIAHTDGSTGNALLPNVNPNFQWIRLAERIPVRIHLDALPTDIQLRVGASASITINKQQSLTVSEMLSHLWS